MRCASCHAEFATPSRFCPHCGAAVADLAATATMSMGQRESHRRQPSSSSASSEEGRFPAGVLLGERYRILGLLGRGGMGEVYRASDLKLNQTVALKFLPDAAGRNPRLLERFHGEVRIARQVSHPNVCRVYDIGEVDGAAYISMEYVDGEDLGGLLRRIGRLPGDKGLEIARKLCAGLAAAHAKGVLHRDLKPANVMIDGRGQVLVMDFGLAAIADQVEGAEVRNGTPAYMAPEQIAGREVTACSDIYSLGLVLFEIFTGQRAFKSADRTAMPSASSMVKDLDPVIERVIARCLDPDPAKRPQTALALARMLPGGDPLAEALAAGDTPSPEMVAASEDTGALSVRWAVLSMAFVVVGIAALLGLSKWTSVLRLTPFPNSTEILAQKARDMAARLGYTEMPVDEAHEFFAQYDYRDWAMRNLKREDYRAQIERGQPSLIGFRVRHSPRQMVPVKPAGTVSGDDPPMNIAGMLSMDLDPQGRLIVFQAVPPPGDATGTIAAPMDWNKLFEAAGLDIAQWTSTEPIETPLFRFDEHKAWTGAYPKSPDMPIRIEGAAWMGRPISFEILGPWRRPASDASPAPQTPFPLLIIQAVEILLFVFAILLAWLNYQHGRCDVRGALRLAGVSLVSETLVGIIQSHRFQVSDSEPLKMGLFAMAIVATLYIALEPYLRRRWPQGLISWSRLLAGEFRDPLLGGHILLGVALGAGVAAFENIPVLIVGQTSLNGLSDFTFEMLSGAGLAAFLLGSLVEPAALTMGFYFLFFLLRVLLRRTWIAAAVVVSFVLITTLSLGVTIAIVAAVDVGFALWVMIRFGLLPFAVMVFIRTFLGNAPLTSDFSAWYADKGLIAVTLALALAVWSFRNALGGRSVLKEDLLER